MRRRLFVLAIVAALAIGMLPAGAVPTPVIAKNLELLNTFPDVSAISTAFSQTSPTMYVNTLNGITTYDISNPTSPKLLGALPLPHFENERMTIGERADGTKFVLVGLDIYGVTPTKDPTKPNAGDGYELIVVDVTNPAAPAIRGRLLTTTSVHTVQCIGLECNNAYSAGAYDAGKFSVFDLTDLDNPKEIKTVASAAGDGHQWDYDSTGLIWHSGFNGIAAFDVTDPLNPVTLNATDKNGQKGKSKYNNFILHNSYRPFAENFTQTADPSGRLDSGPPALEAGNVLLATEEDYDNPVCGGDAGEGSFSTWHVPYLDAAQYEGDNPGKKTGNGKIAPLDSWNTEILDTGTRTPLGGLCSAHYFTVDDAGFVAQGWYQQGTRILDVRDPSDIKQVGYFFGGGSEVWIPYFVPEYGPDGKQTGKSTDIIYTNDVARGIDVLKFTPPATAPADTAPVEAPILPEWLAGGANALAASLPSKDFGYLCRLPRL